MNRQLTNVSVERLECTKIVFGVHIRERIIDAMSIGPRAVLGIVGVLEARIAQKLGQLRVGKLDNVVMKHDTAAPFWLCDGVCHLVGDKVIRPLLVKKMHRDTHASDALNELGRSSRGSGKIGGGLGAFVV